MEKSKNYRRNVLILSIVLLLIGYRITNHTVGPGGLWFDGGYTNIGLIISVVGGIILGFNLQQKK